ncbi:unnamed protein product [Cunninghamella echinulata]
MLLLLFSIAISLFCVKADSIPPTFLQGCTLLKNQKIYCYGGVNSVDIYKDFQPTNQFYSLDITTRPTPEQANNNWQKIELPPDYQLEPRAEFAHTVTMNGSRWVILGGAGSSNNYMEPTLKNVSITFNIHTNTWSTLNFTTIAPNVTISPGTIQLQGASVASFLSGGESIIFASGGLRLNNNPSINMDNTSVFSVIRYTDDSGLNAKVVGFDPPGRYNRRFRSQEIVVNNSQLFHFSGFSFDLSYPPYNNSVEYIENKENATSFLKGFGIDIATKGTFIYNINEFYTHPTFRYWHTLTEIPNTGQILLYGGIFNQQVNTDYCYIFNSTLTQWYLISFNENASPGPVYGHAAVLVGNDLLYIIGGADQEHQLRNDIQILNLTSLTWLDSNTNTTSNPPLSMNTSLPLSTGAIIGISIGSIVAASLIIAYIVLFILKRRKNSYVTSGHIDVDKMNELKDNQNTSYNNNYTTIINNDTNNYDDKVTLVDGNQKYKPTLENKDQIDDIIQREKGTKPYDDTPHTFKPDLGGEDHIVHHLCGVKPAENDHIL